MAPENSKSTNSLDEIESIRSILFGQQSKQLDERFAVMDKELAQFRSDYNRLRKDFETEQAARKQAEEELKRRQEADNQELRNKMESDRDDLTRALGSAQEVLQQAMDEGQKKQESDLRTAQTGLKNDLEKAVLLLNQTLETARKGLEGEIKRVEVTQQQALADARQTLSDADRALKNEGDSSRGELLEKIEKTQGDLKKNSADTWNRYLLSQIDMLKEFLDSKNQ